jgi:hypothetical protein
VVRSGGDAKIGEPRGAIFGGEDVHSLDIAVDDRPVVDEGEALEGAAYAIFERDGNALINQLESSMSYTFSQDLVWLLSRGRSSK